MSDSVWVKLDRDEAEWLWAWSRPSPNEPMPPCLSSARHKVFSALSEPSENQVEKAARAIAEADPEETSSWEQITELYPDQQWRYQRMARAVLFGVQEKP